MIAHHRPTVVAARPALRSGTSTGTATTAPERPGQVSKPYSGSLVNQAELVTAPYKPTAAMLANGAAAGDVSVEVAWRVYRAMLEASETKAPLESSQP